MHALWLSLTALLTASLTVGSANEASQVLDSDLKSWNRLKRDAGYYTESGKWRGGVYQSGRTTETEQYHCLDHTDTHCASWNASERRPMKHETGNCTCGETASPYCHQWTCNTRFEYSCGSQYASKTCVVKEELNCDCIVPAENGRYCWKWHCREDGNAKPGGYHENEDYECVIPDVSEEYCFRWLGNTTSKYQLESTACQCFERGESFCNYWQCRERGLERCSRRGLGWCSIEIAIGVGGGMGLLTLACCIGVLFFVVLICRRDESVNLVFVPICFVVVCLPWSVGVAIWGGIFGMPWVLLMWSVGIIAICCCTKLVNTARKKRRNEQAELRSQSTHNLELSVLDIKTPQDASGGIHVNPSGA